jgi:uncharacterized membrane protein YidH (DUF202 family)
VGGIAMSGDRGGPDTGQLAVERTFFAAERTLFAALRTGLSIAGGGSLVITLLGDAWPAWVQAPLVTTFLVVGYGITYLGLGRYRRAIDEVDRRHPGVGRSLPPSTLIVGLVVLQVAILAVVLLFLFEVFAA